MLSILNVNFNLKINGKRVIENSIKLEKGHTKLKYFTTLLLPEFFWSIGCDLKKNGRDKSERKQETERKKERKKKRKKYDDAIFFN